MITRSGLRREGLSYEVLIKDASDDDRSAVIVDHRMMSD